MDSKIEVGQENIYFEMESKPEDNTGTYEDIIPKNDPPQAKPNVEAQSCEDSTKVKHHRLFFIASAITVASLLTALATLVLAVVMMTSRSEVSADTLQLEKRIQELEKSLSALQKNSISRDIEELEKKMKKDMENMKKEVSADLAKLETKIKKDVEDAKNQVSIPAGNNTELENIRFSVKDAAQTLIGLNTSVNEKFQQFQQKIMQLDQKVTNRNSSTTIIGPPGFNGTNGDIGPAGPSGPAGPPGLPGYNGTKGPAGPSGLPGSQGIRGPSGHNGTKGPPGPGASSCIFKTLASSGVTPFTNAVQEAQVTESNSKTIIGVTCDTNDAKVFQLSSTIQGGKRIYKCKCEGTLSTGVLKMFCNIHYWECQS